MEITNSSHPHIFHQKNETRERRTKNSNPDFLVQKTVLKKLSKHRREM